MSKNPNPRRHTGGYPNRATQLLALWLETDKQQRSNLDQLAGRLAKQISETLHDNEGDGPALELAQPTGIFREHLVHELAPRIERAIRLQLGDVSERPNHFQQLLTCLVDDALDFVNWCEVVEPCALRVVPPSDDEWEEGWQNIA